MSGIGGLGDTIRYPWLASDPGLQQVKQHAKTVLAVVAALLAFHRARPSAMLFAGMNAGFLMQCTARTSIATCKQTAYRADCTFGSAK